MGVSKQIKTTIQAFMINLIFEQKNPYDQTLKIFKISRQTLTKYLNELEEKGIIESHGGKTRKKYSLKPFDEKIFEFDLNSDIDEETIYENSIKPYADNLKENIKDILHYSFTEMVNNVIDHSGSEKIIILFTHNFIEIEIVILDYGHGIFKKIMKDHKLQNEEDAIFQLSKGKLTSDETNHSGEGIFFTSRACDSFSILSKGKAFGSKNERDIFFRTFNSDKKDSYSTLVGLSLNKNSTKDLTEIFDRFSDVETGFYKTEIKIKLAEEFSNSLISRSQAKRVVSGLEAFKDIIFDFEGVRLIGQGFADQIFRVYKNANPDKTFTIINANPKVQLMLNHVNKEALN